MLKLADSLLAHYNKPEDLIGEHSLLKQLTKMLVERALEVENDRPPGPRQERPSHQRHRQHVRVRDSGVVCIKAVYPAIGVSMEGHKEVLGLWIWQTEMRVSIPPVN